MKVLFYSIKDFERGFIESANAGHVHVDYTDKVLSVATAALAKGYDAVSIFPHDEAGEDVLKALKDGGTRYIAIRAAGYDNVDLDSAHALGIKVANVPAYSPYSIAEHAVAMLLALNRKLILADRQVHRHDFTLTNLVGFDLHGKTAGIVGTGKTGSVLARILHGFGCHLVGYDIRENEDLIEQCNMQYTDLKSLCFASDIVSLHVCLTDQTKHLMSRSVLAYMKPGSILINTARGPVIDTEALVEFLEAGLIGGAALDVYEKEKGVFFRDRSQDGFKDPLLERLLRLPNVLVTPHQAFATKEALSSIAATTFENLYCWAVGKVPENEFERPLTNSPARSFSR